MKVYHKSEDHRWETPQDLYDYLNDEFSFTLDVCAVEATQNEDLVSDNGHMRMIGVKHEFQRDLC